MKALGFGALYTAFYRRLLKKIIPGIDEKFLDGGSSHNPFRTFSILAGYGDRWIRLQCTAVFFKLN